jgi:hypothetical protein
VDHNYDNRHGGAITGMQQSTCSHCKLIAFWDDGRMVYPLFGSAPPPNSDLPHDIVADYDEARNILPLSTRGAAALLRLCIQKLCKHLGEKGDNINEDIKSLAAKGLPPQIQQALDIVRVVGNQAVHPGQLDLRDDTETATKLFVLVNLIADVMITQPKHISEMYDSVISPSQQAAIEARGKPKTGK